MSEKAPGEVRVLQVVSALGLGGAETWLLELFKHLNSREENGWPKIRMDIFLTGKQRGELEPEFQRLGVALSREPFQRGNLPRFARSFRRVLRESRYDAIHDHQDNIAGLHFLAGAGLLPPVRIAHVHNPLLHIYNYASSPARKATVAAGRWWLKRLGTHILGTSSQILREYGFFGRSFSRLTVMPLHCGIDTELFALDHEASKSEVASEIGLPPGARTALFVGRLDSSRNQKNPLFAMEAARAAIRRDPKLHLLMAGSWGSVGGQLAEMAAAWDEAPNIHILGPRRDVPKLMAAADVLLAPSIQEGLGMVIVEAQAAGLPVLASDSIPKECVVVPGMVEFLPLSLGAGKWAEAVAARISDGRSPGASANHAVRLSPFSIQNSADALAEIYSGGALRQA